MPTCSRCGEFVNADRVLCPQCRAPLTPLAPTSRRPRAIIALVLVVIAMGILVRLLIVHG